MSTTFCPDLSGDPAVLFVGGGYEKFMQLSNDTYRLALNAANGLRGFTVKPITFNASFDFAEDLRTFERPTRPDIDTTAFTFQRPAMPAAPASFDAGEVALTPAPTLTAAEPTMAFIPRPASLDIAPPRAAPVVRAPVIPEAPDFQLPDLPTFETLRLPAVPDIQLPTFSDTAPVFDIGQINEVWSFSPESYVSDLLNRVRGRIGTMLDGGTGLPAAIERALFERSRSRLDEEGTRAIQEVHDEFGTRGFSEPNGMLANRVARVRQDVQNRAADINRDLTIQVHNVEIENLRFAVSQGIALETTFANLQLEEQRLLLAAAQFQRDSAIAVLNSRISVFNARLQAYQTGAQVFAERIRAELAKAEVYRAQIEGERARGEINEQRVRLYAEQVRTVQTMADLYRTRVQAVQAEAETNRQIIDGYRAEVEAYGERWRAYTSEWEGYRAAVDAEGRKADVYSSLVGAFGVRVQAWDREQNARFDRERLRIAQHDQRLRTWDSELRSVLAELQAEQGRITAEAQRAGAVAQLYSADASVAQAESSANDRTFELGLRREEAQVNTELRAAEIRIQESVQLLTLLSRTRETLAQVMSQLSASTMSAINFSASVGSTQGRSTGCTTNYSFNGEIADA